jgi:ribosomal-protein-alanine N-acetyltransferase
VNPAAWRLRQASPLDLDALLVLEQSCPEAPHWSRSAWIAALTQGHETTPARIVFLAENQTGLLGMAVGICAGALAELESVAVSEPARRQGIGKALCRQIMDWSRQSGAHSLELEVRASSERALALYRSLGFLEQGRRPSYYRNPSADAVLMVARL